MVTESMTRAKMYGIGLLSVAEMAGKTLSKRAALVKFFAGTIVKAPHSLARSTATHRLV
jgi:hypothetical protein